MIEKATDPKTPYDPEEYETRKCPYCKEYQNHEEYVPGARRRRRNRVSLKTHISKEHPEKPVSGKYGELSK